MVAKRKTGKTPDLEGLGKGFKTKGVRKAHEQLKGLQRITTKKERSEYIRNARKTIEKDLKSNNPYDRAKHLPTVVEYMRPGTSLKVLSTALKDANPKVRELAVVCLHRTEYASKEGRKAAIGMLDKAAKDSEYGVRSSAMRALGDLRAVAKGRKIFDTKILTRGSINQLLRELAGERK